MTSPITSLDQANHIAVTKGFQGIVEAAMANNAQLGVAADAGMAANQGAMNTAFQTHLAQVKATATSVNAQLEQIIGALGMTLGNFNTTDGDNASAVSALTGMLPTGTHFGGASV